MSLHKSMHSLQMYTEGPAMSFLTSFWFFPQKEQYKSLSSLSVFSLSDINAPNFNHPFDYQRQRQLNHI